MVEDNMLNKVAETLSSAEMFYRKISLKNSDYAWNEFTLIDTNTIDMVKLDNLL